MNEHIHLQIVHTEAPMLGKSLSQQLRELRITKSNYEIENHTRCKGHRRTSKINGKIVSRTRCKGHRRTSQINCKIANGIRLPQNQWKSNLQINKPKPEVRRQLRPGKFQIILWAQPGQLKEEQVELNQKRQHQKLSLPGFYGSPLTKGSERRARGRNGRSPLRLNELTGGDSNQTL